MIAGRRGFLGRGALVSLIGALVGLGVVKTEQSNAVAGGIGYAPGIPSAGATSLPPLPALPAPRDLALGVELTVDRARFTSMHTWDDALGTVVVQPDAVLEIDVVVEGRTYTFNAWARPSGQVEV